MPQGMYAGQTGGYKNIVSVTLTLDTNAYANGDLLADTQVIDAALRLADGTGRITSIVVLDEDDQTLYSFNVFFLDANVTMGTENSAPSISDTNARNILGMVAFATTDGLDIGGAKLYAKHGLNVPVKAISGTDDLAIAVVIGTGTPTHSASGIKIRLGIEQD